MGWKQKESVADGEAIDWDEQEEFEGILKSERKVDTKFGEKSLYGVEDMEGEPFVIWGSAQLDRKLADVDFGTRILIKHLGLKRGNGGNRYHDFEVNVWDEDEAEAPAAEKPARRSRSSRSTEAKTEDKPATRSRRQAKPAEDEAY